MNLTVEWVHPYNMKEKPQPIPDGFTGIKPIREIPVIRIAALRAWLEQAHKTKASVLTPFAAHAYREALLDLLAQLPEEG